MSEYQLLGAVLFLADFPAGEVRSVEIVSLIDCD